MYLERYISDLADESKPIRYEGLAQLSDLGPEELDKFRASLPLLEAEQRHQMLSRMVAMAEENVDLDFTAVFKFALKDSAATVRERAVAGLWECEDRSLITAFINLLHTDPSDQVRAAAAQALGKFATMAEDGKLMAHYQERIQGALLAVAVPQDCPIEIRRRALEAIAVFSSDNIRDLIMSAYYSGDPRLRQSAIYAMGRNNGHSEWLTMIMKELGDANAAIRYEAASACGEIGEEEAVPQLIPLLQDDDLQVRVTVIHALGSIGGSAARRALQASLKSSDAIICEAAREACEMLEFNEDPLAFSPR